MKNYAELFTGNAIQERANSVAEIKSMKSGIAKLVSAETYTTKSSGASAIKLSFQGMNEPNNPNYGHNEILSTSAGDKFVRLFEKAKYLIKIAGREDIYNALPTPFTSIIDENNQAVTSFLYAEPIYADVVDESTGETKSVATGQFEELELIALDQVTTNAQMKALQDTYGEDVTFFWLNDMVPFQVPTRKNEETGNLEPITSDKEEIAKLHTAYRKRRVVLRWNNRETLCQQLSESFKALIGTNYKLKFEDNKNNDFRTLKKIMPSAK